MSLKEVDGTQIRTTKVFSWSVLEEAQLCYHRQTCQAGITQQQNLPMRKQFQFVILHMLGILIILELWT